MNSTGLFFDSRNDVLNLVSCPENEPEMTEFESAFLCGLIREKKPRKILEVGVAAGGTTAIVLDCLSKLGQNDKTEVYSVDVSEAFYRGEGELSGYLAEEYKKKVDWHGNHRVFLGKYLPEIIDEIGGNIDFVILDTIHRLPGELLDFLTVFPYLTMGACVVLHDIALFHYFAQHPQSVATQLLFNSVAADKCVIEDPARQYGYPNIGAFFINCDTAKYLDNVFHALTIPWNYLPPKNVFDNYVQSFQHSYSTDLVRLASVAYEMQTDMYNRKVAEEKIKSSFSYRLRRIITFLPRKIRNAFLKR